MGSKPKYCVQYDNLVRFLTLDGHASRCSSSELLHIARENNVIIFTFPSHTTAALQPPDMGYAGLFETCLQQLLTAVSTAIKIEK
jgi:hypothetical protein